MLHAVTPENKSNIIVDYDPEGAIKLLASAGWVNRNDDGWLIKEGKIFEIDFGITQSLERIFTPYQEDLAKVGIKMNLMYELVQIFFYRLRFQN